MVSHYEQADLIRGIAASEGFMREEFTSAAGIHGNFKICLAEALQKDSDLRQRFTGHMVNELAGVEVIAATGGAVALATEISAETGLPLLEIKRYKHNRDFFYPEETRGRQILEKRPRIGFIEDVTSTCGTVANAIDRLQMGDIVDVIVTAWRRGEEAPEAMTTQEVRAHNQRFNFRDLYELPSTIPITAVVERKIPLWVPLESQVVSYLPELART